MVMIVSVFMLLMMFVVIGLKVLVIMLFLNLFSWFDVLMNSELMVFIWFCILFGVISCISEDCMIMLILFVVFIIFSVRIDS